MRSTFAAVTLFLFSAGTARAANPDEGRRHARTANKLAAQGNCIQALPSYDRAYDELKDPALLFNRAECRRKVGSRAGALADYKQFLTDLPKAPNRRTVEERIVVLERELAATTPAAAPSLPDEPVRPAWTPRPRAELSLEERPLDEPSWTAKVPTWAWVGLGAVLVGAGAAAGYVVYDRSRPDAPVSALGNQRF